MTLESTMQYQSSAFRDLVWLGSRRRALRIIAVWLSLAASVGFCQETDPNASEARQPPVETVTAEDIDRALKQVDDSTELDDPTKLRLKELYSQAKRALEGAAREQKTAIQFNSWIRSASKDIEEAKRQKELPLKAYDVAAGINLELNQLSKDRTALEQQVADAQGPSSDGSERTTAARHSKI
jgi:hypothetical protein